MARSTRPASTASLALANEIRRLRKRGFSVREIGRRTGISKSHVHNIAIGKRSVSPARAVAAAERLSRERPALVLTNEGLRAVDPLSRRERQKIGRYMRAIQDAKNAADFRAIRRRFRRTIIKTRDGEIRLETDPTTLRGLDDAGLLDVDEVFHYLITHYPQLSSHGTKQERTAVSAGLNDGAQQGAISKGAQRGPVCCSLRNRGSVPGG